MFVMFSSFTECILCYVFIASYSSITIFESLYSFVDLKSGTPETVHAIRLASWIEKEIQNRELPEFYGDEAASFHPKVGE